MLSSTLGAEEKQVLQETRIKQDQGSHLPFALSSCEIVVLEEMYHDSWFSSRNVSLNKSPTDLIAN